MRPRMLPMLFIESLIVGFRLNPCPRSVSSAYNGQEQPFHPSSKQTNYRCASYPPEGRRGQGRCEKTYSPVDNGSSRNARNIVKFAHNENGGKPQPQNEEPTCIGKFRVNYYFRVSNICLL